MAIIKEADFRKEIKSNPASGYLFFGEEDYLKAFAMQTAKAALCADESLAVFNELRIEGLDFSPQKLQEALMPLPMMQDRKLITVRGLSFTSMRGDEVDAICEVLATLSEYDYNTVIFNVPDGGFDPGYLPKRPSQTYTKLSEFLTPVEFERCTTAKLTSWVQKHFAHNGITASPDFCRTMTEYCGHIMYVLASEIDKLSFYLLYHQRTEPTVQDMHTACIPATEYDAFAFANAVMEGKSDTALAILADYKRRRMDPIIVLGEVNRVICEMASVAALSRQGLAAYEIAGVLKLHEFRVGLYQKSLRASRPNRIERTLQACRDADASAKQTYLLGNSYASLERLICVL